VTEHEPNGPLPGLSLIIPAYNEEGAIAGVISRAAAVLADCALQWEIIVVSDCSADRTAERAEAAGARVIIHPVNKGYGNALKTGITAASYGTVAIMDADGSYPPEELQRLLPFASRFDMVVGQRSGVHFKGGPFKRAGRRLQLFLVEFTTGTRIPDVNSGLRIFPRETALTFFDTLCGGFSFTTSITLSMLMLGYTVKFVPVVYEARIGRSHIRYYRDTMRSLQIITHAILKYNPIKAFLTLSFIPLALTILGGVGAGAALLFDRPGAALWMAMGALICLMTALLIFALGMVATSLFVSRTPAAAPGRRTA